MSFLQLQKPQELLLVESQRAIELGLPNQKDRLPEHDPNSPLHILNNVRRPRVVQGRVKLFLNAGCSSDA